MANPQDGVTLPPHAAAVLALYAASEAPDELYWAIRQTMEIGFMAKCSDFFMWGCADLERIEPEDIDLLTECFRDLAEHDATYFLGELFCARKRKMRPMRLWLGTALSQENGTARDKGETEPGPVRDLFLACGPERDPRSEG